MGNNSLLYQTAKTQSYHLASLRDTHLGVNNTVVNQFPCLLHIICIFLWFTNVNVSDIAITNYTWLLRSNNYNPQLLITAI